jgi:starvation-inducible outer membrane lipoprotein
MLKLLNKNMRIIVLTTMCTVVTACSSTSKDMSDEQAALKAKNEQALAESGYKCRSVKLTGSHIATRVCDTRRQRQDREQDAQKMISDVVNGAPPPQSK